MLHPALDIVFLKLQPLLSLNGLAFDPLHARSQFRSASAWPFTVAFQGLSSSPTRGQRCIRCADPKTLGDKGSFPGGVLTHPGVVPSASCIQRTDLQLSQVQVISLWYPPFTPQGLGMSTGHKREALHGSILHYSPWCQMGSKLAGVYLSPNPFVSCSSF